MTRAKPCPVCGEQAPFDLVVRNNRGKYTYRVKCSVCGNEGRAGVDTESAIARWNAS